MPALFTRMSTGPKLRPTRSTMSRIAAGFDMSASSKRTGTSWRAPITWQRFSASIGSAMPFSTIIAPAAASALAMPRPMPLVEPVMTATLPSIGRALPERAKPADAMMVSIVRFLSFARKEPAA